MFEQVQVFAVPSFCLPPQLASLSLPTFEAEVEAEVDTQPNLHPKHRLRRETSQASCEAS